MKDFGIDLSPIDINSDQFQILIVAVAHDIFCKMKTNEWARLSEGKIIFDAKGIVPRQLNPIRL